MKGEPVYRLNDGARTHLTLLLSFLGLACLLWLYLLLKMGVEALYYAPGGPVGFLVRLVTDR